MSAAMANAASTNVDLLRILVAPLNLVTGRPRSFSRRQTPKGSKQIGFFSQCIRICIGSDPRKEALRSHGFFLHGLGNPGHFTRGEIGTELLPNARHILTVERSPFWQQLGQEPFLLRDGPAKGPNI